MDADAPSGLAINEIADAVQTALSARVDSPAGIASGEVPVWDGTKWVRSSATRVGPSSLGTGTADATAVLRGDGTWNELPRITTSDMAGGPPASPSDKDIWIARAVADGVSWTFQYNAGSASAYKWEFIGGADWDQAPSGSVSAGVSNSVWFNVTSGPSVTVPRAGDYRVRFGGYVQANTFPAAFDILLRDAGSTSGPSSFFADLTAIAVFDGADIAFRDTRTLVAGETLTVQWMATSATAQVNVNSVWLSLQPVRIA